MQVPQSTIITRLPRAGKKDGWNAMNQIHVSRREYIPSFIMSTAKVYGSILSTCTQRVLVVLEEARATYDLIDIDMRAGKHHV